MAVTSGFYNAQNHDRMYNADDMGFALSMAITDGVDNDYQDKLVVSAGSGLTINVGTGRAFLNGHWIRNDTTLNLSLEAASTNLNRIDAIVIDVKGADAYRTATIDVVKGTSASEPVKPALIKNDSQKRWQYALAYVTIPAGAVNVLAANIEDVRGTSECPWIIKTGAYDSVLSSASINAPQTKVVKAAIDVITDKLNEVCKQKAYSDNTKSIEKVMALWADAFKKTNHQFNVYGQIQCNTGYYFFQVDMLYSTGEIEGCTIKPYQKKNLYSCYRLMNQPAVLTELAPMSAVKDSTRATYTGKTLPNNIATEFTLNYPSGYTYDNCQIISVALVYNNTRYYMGFNSSVHTYIGEVYMTSSGIIVRAVNTTSSQITCDFEIGLQKV